MLLKAFIYNIYYLFIIIFFFFKINETFMIIKINISNINYTCI